MKTNICIIALLFVSVNLIGQNDATKSVKPFDNQSDKRVWNAPTRKATAPTTLSPDHFKWAAETGEMVEMSENVTPDFDELIDLKEDFIISAQAFAAINADQYRLKTPTRDAQENPIFSKSGLMKNTNFHIKQNEWRQILSSASITRITRVE